MSKRPEWLPQGIRKGPADEFIAHANATDFGRNLFEQINKIDVELAQLGKVNELSITSRNDGTFRPTVDVEEVREFLRSKWLSQRDELVERFNQHFRVAP